MLIILFTAVLLLTYSNGANDNFKGVATLWGSGSLNYKSALVLATVATFGSVCSYFFADALIKGFSGKGLVPDNIIHSVNFVLAVALAAGATVLLATRFGFPVSTTHGLVGALIGSGLVAVGKDVNFAALGKSFFLPLLLSPFLAIILSSVAYWILHNTRKASGISEDLCICVGKKWVPVQTIDTRSTSFTAVPVLETKISTTEDCVMQYQGNLFGISFQSVLNNLHYASAAIVSFARGLNDTPKLVSLLLITSLFKIPVYIGVLAFVMAVGGLLNARKVAATMSKKISKFNHGQGFTANFIIGALVIAASKFGLPVSTTHVSVGSIYGIGIVNKTANHKEISKIALSWVLTLPIAALLSAFFYFILRQYS
jgi:PiT family inorganic phosphate transporter